MAQHVLHYHWYLKVHPDQVCLVGLDVKELHLECAAGYYSMEVGSVEDYVSFERRSY